MIDQLTNFNLASVFLINLSGFFIAYWIYFSGKKSRVNQLMLFWTISSLMYVNFGFLPKLETFSEHTLLFTRLRFVAVSFFFIFGYFFYLYFPIRESEHKYAKWIYLFFWLAAIPISLFTPYIIEEAQAVNENIEVIFGRGIELFFIFSALSVFIIFWILFKKYFKLPKKRKRQVEYFLVGAFIFAIANLIFNIVSPLYYRDMRHHHLGDFSTIFLLGFTAYAIVKGGLFEIKVVLTSMIVGLIAVLLSVDLLLFTEKLWIQISKGIVLAIFLAFGYFLVRSVIKEIERKEELETLSDQLVETNIQLKKANERLKKLDEAKSEFISIASHQLRTPLTAIKGYLSMIISGSYGEISDEVREKMKEVLESSERLISLINDLLNVSRIESGKLKIKFEKADLKKFLKKIVNELEPVVKEKGLYLKLEIDDSIKAEVDKDKVRQAILNIIDNAIKYTEEGGITIRVKKKISGQEKSALIEIEDTGKGMEEEEISNIFSSFTRGSAGDLMHIEGAGLGLYIAKKFIDMHDGEIWLKSEGVGEGTCFFIELPLK